MAKTSFKKKQLAELASPQVQLSEDEPHDGYLYLHAPRHMSRNDGQMAEAFELIRENSELGAKLLRKVHKKKVKFLRTEFESDTTGGESFGDEILLSSQNTFPEDVCILPHELMHWRQPDMPMYGLWDIRSRFLASLTSEAGAETCAIKVAHQMRESGYAEAFNLKANAEKWEGYHKLYRKFDATLKKSVKEQGDNPELDATDAAFHAYFKQGDIVWDYGLNTLEEYIVDIADDASIYPRLGFSLDLAAAQAKIGKNDYLVHQPVDLPLTDKRLFKGNDCLRQAFDYAEVAHILQYNGGDHSDLAFYRRWLAMEKDDNPFMNLNLGDVVIAHAESKTPDNIVLTMLELAELEPVFGS